MNLHDLVAHCDQLLDAKTGSDYGPNGLQVEGRREVRKIVTGVSACLELFERARAAEADVVLVHHGILWRGLPLPIVGHHYRRIAALVEAGIALVAYHLPLDRHPELGNNAIAVKRLGLYSAEPFGVHEGSGIGFAGRYPVPIRKEELVARCREVFAQEPRAFLFGPDEVRSVGVITGGAQGEFHQAIAAGLDAYITGEASEWVMNIAKETQTHYLAVGHYASETLGIRALGDHLARRFELAHEFIDIPNPI